MPLDDYVLEIKNNLKQIPNLTEEEIIMFVYLDLARRFKFDDDFFFGGSKRKKQIYHNSRYISELNKCFENNKIICRSSSYILEYVLTKLNIKIRTIYENNPLKKYQHVLNVITPSDGSEEYSIDLQNDIANICYHNFTSNFGKSIDNDNTFIISKERQKQIHQKLGYISSNNMYCDDYIELFKMYTLSDIPFSEKIDLVLKNIDPYPYPNINYWERRWHHEYILDQLFDSSELKNKLNTVEFYTINNNIKEYNTGFFVCTKEGTIVYYYSKDNYCYDTYYLSEFARKVLDEDIHYNQGIMGLSHEISNLKSEKKLVKIIK